MSKLEPWQRYRKATPCPVCGGYGAYKPENRCKGFLSLDGEGAFCSQVGNSRSPVWFEAIGLDLYWHPFVEKGEGEQVGRQTGWPREEILRHPLLRMRWRGLQRKLTRDREARRPPTEKDFG
jgi:hypothetical protein